ncbi:TRAP transporter, DctM subunit [Cohaesibacter marisflavi]|uniref:TRAP transporter large permease protein n=1 Tax=Cohaesibacter marisflavi TaxID=655353 RepID=A0A1I5IR56_9HYPH|nr:TRAP transporter large permease subunit [Cohaesibacter marisflavi]SFO62893.1 TRAP transporter, DctM subunit [Cohaesibacter marisflavi]
MNEALSISIFLFALFFLLGTSVWVGASLLLTAMLGMYLFTSAPIGDALALTVWGSQSSWTLTALPLFIWMGEILYRTNLSETLFRGIAPFMRRMPGGLLHVNVGASAIFAAISGSSAATVATVGKMAIPELRKRGYPERQIVGSLAGAGTLGLLIPPSISMIIYGVTVNESIAKLFMAAMIPGVCLALLFMGYIALWGLRHGEKMQMDPSTNWSEKLSAFLGLLPVVALIVAVIGSIYGGVATATEAAALGVLGSFVLAFLQKTLTRDTFVESVLGAVRTTTMVMFILMGSGFLSLAMGFTGIPKALAEVISTWDPSPLALIMTLTVFYILLGCFLDGISSIVLTMAVIEPMVRAAGFDMLWFGVYLMIVVEMAQITPPIGFNLFVLQGMTGHDIGVIARAAVPSFLVMCLFVVLLVIFPDLALWLPSVLK